MPPVPPVPVAPLATALVSGRPWGWILGLLVGAAVLLLAGLVLLVVARLGRRNH